MPWIRSRKTLAAIVFIFLALAMVALIVAFTNRVPANHQQRLDDGSVLTLTRVEVGAKIDFVHGNFAQKFLGNAIPSNGVHLGRFYLSRPTHRPFDTFNNKSWLVAEFKLSGPNSNNSPLPKSLFFRQFRYIIYGESGIEDVQELWSDRFTSYPDGFYGYVVTSRFRRDSRWLGIRVEKRPSPNKPEPWQTVADFKFKNPARSAHESWVANPAPIIKSTNGMDFVLGQVTVKVVPHLTNDIWNHIVSAPFEVRSNGLALTNWHTMYIHAEDASGNWDLFASHRSLDPRFVWKLETDFEPWTNFTPTELASVDVPSSSGKSVATNVNGVPVTLYVQNGHLDGEIPTNRTDLALVFVGAEDKFYKRGYGRGGNWGQYHFWWDIDVSSGAKSVRATVAVVPNVHVTFYAQPQLVPTEAASSH
jgi:hypothetical protein